MNIEKIKNSKGITMASLVIMIASIILLSTMAITFGYRYLTETKAADKKYFREVLSSAVTKRENNNAVNSIEYPREGYHISKLETFQQILDEYVPELKNNSEILYDRGLWYIVDMEAAEELGVKESSNYIDVLDVNNNEKVKVALVDYYTGTVYLIETNGVEIGSGISGDTEKVPSNECIHSFNVEYATCTVDKVCLICGHIEEDALGHDYGTGGFAATPIDEEFHYTKACVRVVNGVACGMKSGYERHTGLNDYSFYESGDGTWYHYKGCTKCGWKNSMEEYIPCTIEWNEISDTHHVKQCKVCKHQVQYEHVMKYVEINETFHEYVCEQDGCDYVEIERELHENDGNDKCIKCGCDMSTETPLVLTDIILSNKEYPDSHFVTDNEFIQLTITANKKISNVTATICGYGGDNIKYDYSDDELTCVAELFVGSDIIITDNSEITFSVTCRSGNDWMTAPATATTDEDSYLIYDSLPPTVDYIFKTEY